MYESVELENFAEVTFHWDYSALEIPKLVLLSKGKVVFHGEMRPNDNLNGYILTLVSTIENFGCD